MYSFIYLGLYFRIKIIITYIRLEFIYNNEAEKIHSEKLYQYYYELLMSIDEYNLK